MERESCVRASPNPRNIIWRNKLSHGQVHLESWACVPRASLLLLLPAVKLGVGGGWASSIGAGAVATSSLAANALQKNKKRRRDPIRVAFVVTEEEEGPSRRRQPR